MFIQCSYKTFLINSLNDSNQNIKLYPHTLNNGTIIRLNNIVVTEVVTNFQVIVRIQIK